MNSDPPGLRDLLIDGRVKGKSWKEIGEEHGTGSPGATRSAFQRLTGSSDFKTKGPAIRDVVNGLKEGQDKIVKEIVREVKVGNPIPEPVVPKVTVGKNGPAPLGKKNRSSIWDRWTIKEDAGHAARSARKGQQLIDEVLDIPDFGDGSSGSITKRIGKRGSNTLGDYNPSMKQIRLGNKDSAPGTYIHEFGHHIDNMAFGEDPLGRIKATTFDGRYVSEAFNELGNDRVRKALYEVMVRLEDTRSIRYIRANSSGARLNYLVSGREQFARAFNQYILDTLNEREHIPEVFKFGERMSELIGDQYFQMSRNIPSKYQWATDDFAPVKQAMDSLFRELGWLRE